MSELTEAESATVRRWKTIGCYTIFDMSAMLLLNRYIAEYHAIYEEVEG